MIIYNVTCNVEPPLEAEWLLWMQQVHIPEVMETGCFLSFKILKLLTTAQDDVGVNYAIQYTAETLAKYEQYQQEFGPALRDKTIAKYGERVMAFRTLLEEVV